RTITSGEWDRLYNSLVLNDQLKMDREDYNHNYNTAGVIANGRYDSVRWRYDDNDLKDAWVFRVGGSDMYAIEIICANPLGALSGLPAYTPPEPEPPADYVLTPSIDPSASTIVEPGGDAVVT